MHHDFNPHLRFDSDADLRLYRLRYLCRWPLRRIARHLGVHQSTISRRGCYGLAPDRSMN